MERIDVLDGWRGISISLVLAGHLLPVGPKVLQLNSSAATSGMSVFFILSGFLITTILLHDQNLKKFLIRRVFRIVPLAWLVLLITFVFVKVDHLTFLSHVFFYSNISLNHIQPTTHFWSLCLELHFYAGIAASVLFFGKRALYFIPLISLIFTLNRVYAHAEFEIVTVYRVDDILAGGVLALIHYDDRLKAIKNLLARINPLYVVPLLIACTHVEAGALAYLRGYVAMTMIGASMYGADGRWYRKFLTGRVLFYLATVSYALYVVHGGLRYTWLGSGDTLIKYIKRPLFFVVLFMLAHFSTKYYEKYWISLGHKLSGSSKTR